MTAYSPPILWGSGCTWGAAASTWGASLTTSGRPNLYVAVEGELQDVRSASWRLGRDDWFDVLQPSSGSFGIVGTTTAQPNDDIVVTCDAGLLWYGNVDEVTETIDLSGTWSNITATDIIGRLGTTAKPMGQVTVGSDTFRWLVYSPDALGGTLDECAQFLIDSYAPYAATITVGDSAGSLPTLPDSWYDPPDVTLLEVLNVLERSSNAMMALQPDGSIIIVMRDALVAGSVTMTALTGNDAPFEWNEATSRSSVINHWVLERPAYFQTTVLDTTDTDSVLAYGDRTYSVSDYQGTGYTHFSSALRTALADPRPRVTGAGIHVRDLSQGALFLAPLSWITHDGDTWQVMSVEHSVTPGAEWTVTITADVSQNAIVGSAEPTPA